MDYSNMHKLIDKKDTRAHLSHVNINKINDIHNFSSISLDYYKNDF